MDSLVRLCRRRTRLSILKIRQFIYAQRLSAASVWEISIKVGLGKLSLSQQYRAWMNKAIADLNLHILPISIEYSNAQAALPYHHGDPFDRMIVAQALTEQVDIVSTDGALDPYGIKRIW